MQGILGVSPVRPGLLVAGKAALAVPWAVLGLRLAGVDVLGVTAPPLRVPAAVTAAAGAALVFASLFRLGGAARVGLPPARTETQLASTGPYAFSRNPVYVGALAGCIASCAYVPHAVNLASTIAAALIHHRIVLAEERFLEERFGREWQDYRSRVRRYV